MSDEECPICFCDNTRFVTICCKNSIHEECFKKCISTCMGKCPFCRAQFFVTYEKEIESTRIQYLVFMATLLCMAFFATVIFLPAILISKI